MRNFREYDIWIDSMKLVKEVYLLVKLFPSTEKFSLTSQITRSAVSVPSNIAEGASRRSEKDFARFLEISLGSIFELETQLIIAKNCGYIDENQMNDSVNKCMSLQKRMYSLIKKIRG